MQLLLFATAPEPQKKPPAGRKGYTSADLRFIKAHYTHGTLSGKAAAQSLGHSYGSFRQFLQRNPELKKRGK